MRKFESRRDVRRQGGFGFPRTFFFSDRREGKDQSTHDDESDQPSYGKEDPHSPGPPKVTQQPLDLENTSLEFLVTHGSFQFEGCLGNGPFCGEEDGDGRAGVGEGEVGGWNGMLLLGKGGLVHRRQDGSRSRWR